MTLKLFIFDVGGVFRDSSLAVNEGFRRGFESVGLEYNFKAEDVWHLRGIGRYNRSNEAIKVLLALTRLNSLNSHNSGSNLSLKEIIEKENAEEILDKIVKYVRPSDEELIEEIRKVYKNFFLSKKANKLIKIFPFVNDAIDMLSKKFTLAIFSNANKLTLYRDLKELDLNKFSLILAKEDVSKPKPSEEGIIKIMNELNFTPQETAYIGDCIIDVLAARNAKCKAIVVLSGMGLEIHLRKSKPDYIFKDILDMAKFFTKDNL
jgi:HAD superfamily hydrolase (TIGR01509 family)